MVTELAPSAPINSILQFAKLALRNIREERGIQAANFTNSETHEVCAR